MKNTSTLDTVPNPGQTVRPESPEDQYVLSITLFERDMIREIWDTFQGHFSYVRTESFPYRAHNQRDMHYTVVLHVGMPGTVYDAMAEIVGDTLAHSYCWIIQKDDYLHEHERVFGWHQEPDGSWICDGFTRDPFLPMQDGICGETINTYETGEIAPGHCGAHIGASSEKRVVCPKCRSDAYLT